MSALGHKQTFVPQKKAMSALPPKADMCGALAHVRFGPIADIAQRPLLPIHKAIDYNRYDCAYDQPPNGNPDQREFIASS